MKKILLIISASTAAVFGTPAIAAVDVAPTVQSYSTSADIFSSSSAPKVESAENFRKRGSFRRGFRGRRHGGIGRRHGSFGRHHGGFAVKKKFGHNTRHFRHRDRFRHNDRLRHNRRFLNHDNLHHNQQLHHDEHIKHGHHDHHDHHHGKGKLGLK